MQVRSAKQSAKQRLQAGLLVKRHTHTSKNTRITYTYTLDTKANDHTQNIGTRKILVTRYSHSHSFTGTHSFTTNHSFTANHTGTRSQILKHRHSFTDTQTQTLVHRYSNTDTRSQVLVHTQTHHLPTPSFATRHLANSHSGASLKKGKQLFSKSTPVKNTKQHRHSSTTYKKTKNHLHATEPTRYTDTTLNRYNTLSLCVMFSHNAPRLNTWILGLGYLDRCIIRFFANCNEIGSIVTLLASRTSFLLFCPQIDPSINPLPLRPFSPFSHQNRITIRLPMLRTNRRFSSDQVKMPRCSNAIKPMFWVNFGKIMLQTKIRRVGAQKPNACPAIRFCDCNVLV